MKNSLAFGGMTPEESAAAYKDLDLRGFDPDAPDSDDDPLTDIED